MSGVLDRRANLAGRKALVVGGADGIGRAITLALAEAGADVAFCDNEVSAIDATVAQAERFGRRALGFEADAVVPEQLAAFYQAATSFSDAFHIVVNVVGGTLIQPFMERSPEACADDIRRNYGYVIDSTRFAIPLLRKAGGGCLINFTTIEAHRAAGGLAVYAGAKAATTNFSRAMAWELGPDNIRVNVIAPDSTPSKGNRRAINADLAAMNADVPEEYWAAAHRMAMPLQAPTTEEDMANAVLFLGSDLAKGITGIVLHVDSGTSAAAGMLRWPYDGGGTLPVPTGNTLRKLFG